MFVCEGVRLATRRESQRKRNKVRQTQVLTPTVIDLYSHFVRKQCCQWPPALSTFYHGCYVHVLIYWSQSETRQSLELTVDCSWDLKTISDHGDITVDCCGRVDISHVHPCV